MPVQARGRLVANPLDAADDDDENGDDGDHHVGFETLVAERMARSPSPPAPIAPAIADAPTQMYQRS